MRKLFLIQVFYFYYSSALFSQAVITVDTQDSWGPGRYNKVTFRIDFGELEGFARFTQAFPLGFDVVADSIPAGDFTWVDNQLNMVWLRLPENKIALFSYLIRPERTMKGNFDLGGKLILISGGDTKHTFQMKEKTIAINGTNGVLTGAMKPGKSATKVTKITNTPILSKPDQTTGIVYRVQITLSSSEIPVNEIKRRFDIGPGEKVTIVKSGRMFKYQVGSFSDYDSAVMLHTRLLENGMKDAFIVAYQGENQVRPERPK